MADANSAYTLDHLATLKKFDEFNLLMLDSRSATMIFTSTVYCSSTYKRRSAWMKASTPSMTRGLQSNLARAALLT